MKVKKVPCGSCRLCCQGDAVRLMPSDPKHLYKTEPHPYFIGQWMLAHKENGDCVYLGDKGCTIYSSRPSQCRTLDCRDLLQFESTKYVKKAVIEKAKELASDSKLPAEKSRGRSAQKRS